MSEVKRYKMASDGTHESECGRVLLAEAVEAYDYDSLSTRLAQAEQREATAHELRNQFAEENSRLFAKNLAISTHLSAAQSRVKDLEERNAQLEQRCKELEKDAERYRWLRKQNNRERGAATLLDFMDCDAAIDAALTADGEERG